MRAIKTKLAKLCVRLSRVLNRAAIFLVHEPDAQRKPARPATPAAEPIAVPGGAETPTAIKPQNWRLPSPEEIDRARGECAAHGLPNLKICRGPGKGCNRGWHEQVHCQDCYRVAWHDTRPSAELLAAMERGDA